ncbi:RNA polymerase sigma-70 factor, ECF subfamily [Amycolatopsis sacchari]|uniref:RNA polymerase sigma-70 factor, ECF subfamily n=1 Tax=Amycolatopsis sacchari TaxID=115433 RepID=A0A1I3XE53_9PSEU|nr:RNA polymerase sigma-70 factor, ECF subfamily [Amycolatopsis sacchari]
MGVSEGDVAAFVAARGRLFGIAYRILGSAGEAEDVVQDTWLRWQRADRGAVEDPTAFLATTATRLAINVAQSARVRRERYVGPWLPEPVETAADPALGAERAEAVDLALLVLLERLSPTERAAYVLREAFDYPYRQIAEVLGVGEANARQLVSRSRKHVREGRRARVEPGEHRRLVEAFVSAATTGDLAELERLLAVDVVAWADGGGTVHAAKRPVLGRDRVARFVAWVAAKRWLDAERRFVEANGRTALLVLRDGEPKFLVSLETTVDGIAQVLLVLNPDKLHHVTHVASQERALSGPRWDRTTGVRREEGFQR